MRYLVRTGGLKEKIDYIAKQIEIIDTNIEELNKIKTTMVWEGEASIAFFNNFCAYLKELQGIKNSMILINRYLTSYCNGYTDAYTQLRNKYETKKVI